MGKLALVAAVLLVFSMWLFHVSYADIVDHVMAYSSRYQPR